MNSSTDIFNYKLFDSYLLKDQYIKNLMKASNTIGLIYKK